MSIALATVDDVAAVSTPVALDEVTRVERLIELVSAAVVRYTGQAFEPVTETVTLVPHDGTLRLPKRPVIEVTAVAQYGATLNSSLYEVTANGYLRRPWLTVAPGWGDDWAGASFDTPPWGPGPLTVTYTYGYTTPPDDIALVVAERVAGVRATGGEVLRGASLDGYAETYASVSGGAEAWEPDQRMILDRYRRSGLASLRIAT